ncbi:MAG: YjbQ family protein [Desulfurococcales archaeon]|nr:YjbQ family protein [Desulfurococcales archaeon]
MVIKKIKTHGPMNYFPLRKTIEDEIKKTKLSHGLVTIHVKGATPGIVIIDKNELDNIDKALRKLVPVYGWRHGNAYAHLRSTITSTTHTLYFKENKLELPPNHEIYLVETRPVYNHWRTIHLYIRGE